MRDAFGIPQSLLILGAGSDIAQATARALVARGTTTVLLAGRHPEAYASFGDALRAEGAVRVEAVAFDALSTDQHVAFVRDIAALYGDVDCVLVAFGLLGDPVTSGRDHEQALRILRTNAEGAISITIPIINQLTTQGHGALVVLSNAGWQQPRRTNAVYGAAKAALDSYCQAMNEALVGSGVKILIVRPGFVHSRMTERLRPAPLATTPDAVAQAIVQGLGRDALVAWVPGAMRVAITVLRHLPGVLRRRLDA
jgi:decaprenylphospho-beta-D-erythro-pentofuranosid-2-ulose 2-reductase